MDLLNQNHVKHGLIMSAVTITCLLLMEITGQNETFDNKSPFQVFFMFIAPFIVWYLGIRAKKKAQKNKITFKQGLKEGFKISLVYAIVSPLIFLFYYLYINPPIIGYIKEAYALDGAADAVVISLDMIVQFISAIIFGTIYAAIIARIVRSK